jgi:hypothetical protein
MVGITPGLPERTTGWRSIPLTSISFKKCLVRSEYLIGKEGQGMDVLNYARELQQYKARKLFGKSECTIYLAADHISCDHPAHLIITQNPKAP